MDLEAKHIGFVVASYGISAVVLIGLVVAVVAIMKRREALIARLEADGRDRRVRADRDER